MKITQKKFNELKQLDRIEYRQREDRIEKRLKSDKFGDTIHSFTNLAFKMVMITMIGMLLIPEMGASFFIITLMAIKFMIFFLGLMLILDIVIMFRRTKEMTKMQEEYFNVELNK